MLTLPCSLSHPTSLAYREIRYHRVLLQNRNLSLTPVQGLETPLAGYTGWALGEKIGLAPILRAGIQMTDGKLSLPLHSSSVLHQ